MNPDETPRGLAVRQPRLRRAPALIAILATAATVLLLFCTPALAAEGERVLNPRLSLIGACSEAAVEALDPVEDPGCPTTPPSGPHPSAKFAFPRAVTTDLHGDVYVANFGKNLNGSEGRIDIFGPDGRFISEIPKGVAPSPQAVAVDSTGVLYAWSQEEGELLRFQPSAPYDPAAGEVEYGESPTTFPLIGPDCVVRCENRETGFRSLAINPANDHLFVTNSGQVAEYSSAAEGNEEIRTTGYQASGTGFGVGMALDSTRHRLYVQQGGSEILIYELDEGLPPLKQYEQIGSIEESAVPQHHFGSTLALAVDEGTGDLFVNDTENSRLWEFDEDGNYLSTVEYSLQSTFGNQIAVDNGPTSPNGKLSEEEGHGRFLYVPSNRSGTGHLFAFFISTAGPPEVKSIAAVGVSEDEAELGAKINPHNLETTYSFELKGEGEADWTQVGEGTLAAGNLDAEAAAGAKGLSPATSYRFRAIASNEEGSDEAEGGFTTYGSVASEPSLCPNAPLRTNLSVLLPDCRAYELVTPPDTNAHAPVGARGEGGGSTTRQVSPAGDKVPFRVEGGSLPGLGGGIGGLAGDPYLATRTPTGWSTAYTGPAGSEATSIAPGTTSPDQGYMFWGAAGEGSVVVGGKGSFYMRYPDGHSELLGQGSLGIDPRATGQFVSEGGDHIVFSTGNLFAAVQLEPEAAPTGTKAIYDRTADGITHVVSLKPGEVPFGAGEVSSYLGASEDGEYIAFSSASALVLSSENVLYLRHAERRTYDSVPQARSAHQLSCNVSGNAATTPSYEWLLDGSPIAGATTSHYTPQATQAGSFVQCIAHASNAEGGSVAAGAPLVIDKAHAGGAPPRPPANGLPKLPEPSVGQSLQCLPGSWGGAPSFSYQWLRNGTAIGGATSDTYETQAADSHALLQCEVSGQASGAAAVAVTKAVEVNSAPAIESPPKISNKSNVGKAPVIGNQLSCSEGSWTGTPTIAYQWLRNGAPLAGKTTSTYSVVAGDAGTALQCEVAVTNANGTALAVSSAVAVSPTQASELPSGLLKLSGARTVGTTLQCEAGSWQNSPTFSYRWLRNGAAIGGQTTSSYTLTATDRGKVLECELTATGEKGTVLALAGGIIGEKPSISAANPGQQLSFEGVSEAGSRLFYLLDGDIFAFDAESEETIPFTSTGNATVVTVSADGRSAYFVSPSVLGGENPEGKQAEAGKENLYLSREGQVSFIGTVSEEDVKGKGGLGLWMSAMKDGSLGIVPARSTPDGGVFLFKSRAKLTGYDPEGHAEVYRYDSAADQLRCLSCNPTGSPAQSDATLQSEKREGSTLFSALAWPENLRADGARAFFESSEALVPRDTDGHQDVYEWEKDGVGSCTGAGGCTYLISSPHSAHNEYLWAVSASGDDVFFLSPDLLVAADADETPSIYDARVEGGFPEAQVAAECLGEACQPAAKAPNDSTPASSSFHGAGNVTEEKKAAHKKKHRHKHKRKHRQAKKHQKHAKGKRRAGR
jgi:hypothetical protein